MRILVVGGAGYVGSHACKALAAAGHEPIVFDSLITGHRDAVRWGALEEGDILDAERLQSVFAKHKPAVVMHFAAFAYVGESVAEPSKYYRNNVVGSLCLLEVMRRNSIDKIVFSSTCATYGVPETLPITESTQQRPINPYGQTKVVIERAIADYAHAYGLKWVVMRYFNAAGSDPDGEIGERHAPETHAIPLAIHAAMGLGPRFKVYGADYDTPDGSAVRDYVHVSDIASAHVKAIPYLVSGGESQAFNLAIGRGVSVLEMLAAVEKATGRPVPIDFVERRVGDPPALFAVAERAQQLLGWSPRFVDFDETIATAVRWFLLRHNQKN